MKFGEVEEGFCVVVEVFLSISESVWWCDLGVAKEVVVEEQS